MTANRLSIVTICSGTHRLVTIDNVTDRRRQTQHCSIARPYCRLKTGRGAIFVLSILPSFAFYRAMLRRARYCYGKLSVRLSVRLSVCLSVTLRYCDYIGGKSSKIISWLVSLGCSLFATPTSRGYSKGNTPKFLPE